jgi:hypothetical protein
VNLRIHLGVVLLAFASSGCVRLFEGTVAELDQVPDLTVVLAASEYGDCFRVTSKVPIVYGVTRPKYSLRIAHGMRYWPEFFLLARDNNGTVLSISGDSIWPVEFPRGGDIRRLREARGTDLSHHALLDVPRGSHDGQDLTVQAVREGRVGKKTLAFEVRDSDGLVVGREAFSYQVKTIRCREFDGP